VSVTLRPYAGWTDLGSMRAVVAAGLRDAPDRSYVHPGDVAWWIGWPPRSASELARIAAVWEDDGEVVGFAVNDDGDIGEFVHPRLLDTPRGDRFFSAVDAWIDDGHPDALRYASDRDPAAARRLADVGYRPNGDAIVTFRIPLDHVPDPPRHRVRAVARNDDPTGRARITHAAFGADRPFATYVEDYRRFMSSPAYPEGWDLVAEDDDGVAVACCIAWPDRHSGAGNFEPVATHPDAERLGFATAAIAEGLRRLREAGMTWAIVRTPLSNTGAQALYRSLGFRDWHRLLVFSRGG
jgi:ribosomal protein S18 acetylase RimI-like enzyme